MDAFRYLELKQMLKEIELYCETSNDDAAVDAIVKEMENMSDPEKIQEVYDRIKEVR